MGRRCHMKSKGVKTKIMQAAVVILSGFLSFIYFFMKIRPTKPGRVVFCSRQSDEMTVDFLLLQREIKKIRPDATFVAILNHVKPGFKGYAGLAADILRSMWHLAAAQICVLDSYWPAVSMLKHKDTLKVIQMWHAIGKMKKSGLQALDKKSGRSGALASSLKMHRNYDYFIGGAPFWNKFYKQAFGLRDEQILNYGLPRIDYLLETAESNCKRFADEFPQLAGKKIVLYAPTFRKNMTAHWEDITGAAEYDDVRIIVKNHPEQWAGKAAGGGVIYIDDWKTMDLIAVCDYLITDYSSIALEAAVLRKKTFFWTYDYDEYMENSGTNIDLRQEVPDNMSADIDDIIERVEKDDYDEEEQARYIRKFLPAQLGGSARRIAEKAAELMAGDKRQEI